MIGEEDTRSPFDDEETERRSGHGQRRQAPRGQQHRPDDEKIIHEGRFDVDGKSYFVDMKTNHRGSYLKIKERHAKGNSTILIPAEGFEAFIREINAAITAHNETVE